VEGVYSLTGAMADHRLRVGSRHVAAFVAALAARLGAPGAPAQPAEIPGVEPRWVDAVAKDLQANRGTSLIVAGDRQPAGVHAAVCALNAHLGNTGKTVSYFETKDAAVSSASSLASLVAAMSAGTIQTLVIIGGNPAFDAPADLEFAAAMAKVPHSIALGQMADETASGAEWHIPAAHYLESWGDARAVGGTLSVVQPLILPLFGGRTPVELLGLMIADKDRPGYDIVRDTWKPILGEAEFEQKWNRVLHDGLLAGSELTEVVPTANAQAFAALAPAAGTAAPAMTPTPAMPAALAARMSQVESPMHQHASAGWPNASAAASSRSGSGLACSTDEPSTMVGSRPSSSAASEVPTCLRRDEVAMAHGHEAPSSHRSISRAPGSGCGSRLSDS